MNAPLIDNLILFYGLLFFSLGGGGGALIIIRHYSTEYLPTTTVRLDFYLPT